MEAALPEFAGDRKGFELVFEEKKSFRFVGAKEWVRRFSDASDASGEEREDKKVELEEE